MKKFFIPSLLCVFSIFSACANAVVDDAVVDEAELDAIEEDVTLSEEPKTWAGVLIEDIEGVDTSSFEILNHEYAKDKNYVYYGYIFEQDMLGVIEKIDRKDYAELDDSRKIMILSMADLESFEIIDGSGPFSAQDANYLYSGELAIDPESFVELNDIYAKDKYHALVIHGYMDFRYRELINSDADSFEIVDQHFAKDANQVYGRCITYEGSCFTNLEGAAPESFGVIGNWISRDADNLYFFDVAVGDLDPNNFEIIFASEEYPLMMCVRDNDAVYFVIYDRVQKLGELDPLSTEISASPSQYSYELSDKDHSYGLIINDISEVDVEYEVELIRID